MAEVLYGALEELKRKCRESIVPLKREILELFDRKRARREWEIVE